MIFDNKTSDVKTLIENTIMHAEKDSEDGIAITCIKTDNDGGKLVIVAITCEYALYIDYWNPKIQNDDNSIHLISLRYDFWKVDWIIDIIENLKKIEFKDIFEMNG